MACQDTSWPPVSKDYLCERVLLEQLFSNKNGNALQEGGHRSHVDSKWQRQKTAPLETGVPSPPPPQGAAVPPPRAGDGGLHLIRPLHQLWSCSGHPNRQEETKGSFLQAFFFLLYDDGMQWLEFCSNRNHQLHAAEQVGNYPRTAHTHQGITYRQITDCDVLCTGDREILQRRKNPKVWKTCVLVQNLP